jgi:hypothetical protein
MSISVLPAPTRHTAPTEVESISETMRRLRAEAQARARDHSVMLEQAICDLELLAQDIAEGGESYLGGVRETARRLVPELTAARLQMDSMLGRKHL